MASDIFTRSMLLRTAEKSTILMTTSTEILSICSLNPKNLWNWSSSFRPIWRTEIIKICVSFNKRWSRFKFCHPLVWSLVSLHDINDPLLQCDNDYTWSILSQYYSDGETSLSNNVPPALPTYNIITTLLYLPDTTYRVKIKIKRISLRLFKLRKNYELHHCLQSILIFLMKSKVFFVKTFQKKENQLNYILQANAI